MAATERGTVWVVDDDPDVRDGLAMLLRAARHPTETCASGEALLDRLTPASRGCVLLDVRMDGMGGLEVQREMRRRGLPQPVVFLSGHGDIPMAVRAVQDGALDFLEKPAGEQQLLQAVSRALAVAGAQRRDGGRARRHRARVATLSAREAQVADLLARGLRNAEMAERLGLSERTVEMHRARLLRRLGARTTAEAVAIIHSSRGAG